MSGVRTYEVEACPVHGTEYMQGGVCRALVEKTKTHRRLCHMQRPATAYDARDVDPVLEAARFMLRAAAGEVNARGSREVAEASRIFDKASDQLAEALQPFSAADQERGRD